MLTRRTLLAASGGLAAAGAMRMGSAHAQMLNKQVRVIVGFPAGGGTDVIARIVAEKLRGNYAQTVIVENKPGAAARLRLNTSRTLSLTAQRCSTHRIFRSRSILTASNP